MFSDKFQAWQGSGSPAISFSQRLNGGQWVGHVKLQDSSTCSTLPGLKGVQIPGDVRGGVSAMMATFPQSVVLGVLIFSALGPEYVPWGALAGIVGIIAIGVVAPIMGGTDRLISAPYAPAAALLSVFALGLVQQNLSPLSVMLLVALLSILASAFQVMIGVSKLSHLIRYIPNTVLSGILTGVGLIIIGSQMPKFFGMAAGTSFWQTLTCPELWDQRAWVVGMVTALVMVSGSRWTKAIPGPITALAAGMATYGLFAMTEPAMLELAGNKLVIGSLGSTVGVFFDSIVGRWRDVGNIQMNQLVELLGGALTLAALASVDTLKTCAAMDQLTSSQHDPNQELVAQGMANMTSSVMGGVYGAGTMGGTLANLSNGGQTRLSGVVGGISALIAALALMPLIAWIPVSSLAGILIVIGLRMIDKKVLFFLQSRDTLFDFVVAASVVVVALTIGPVIAAGTGMIFAVLLYWRGRAGDTITYNKHSIHGGSSLCCRPGEDVGTLEPFGNHAVAYELQGSLSFGTPRQFYSDLEEASRHVDYLILDFRLVDSIDVTAAHKLYTLQHAMREWNTTLLFSNVRDSISSGINLRAMLERAGVTEDGTTRIFRELRDAIEWIEGVVLSNIGQREEMPVVLN
ncbi:MAG: SulP family inorganic anion transporter [Magnetococcales bacterium]|nr:SulP family inorganic anion transporter [Magnetococcales bacterium]